MLKPCCLLRIAGFFVVGAACWLAGSSVPAVQAADWYLRASVGYEWSRSADFSDDNCGSVHPPALFGCGTGSDGRPLGAYGEFGSFGAFEAAVGRWVMPWLRMDVSLNWRPNMAYSGEANFLEVAGDQPVYSSASACSAMLNAFVDLAELAGRPSARLQPYVGGGLGLSYNRLDGVTYLFPGLTTHKISITPSGNALHAACMLAAGTGIVLSERLVLDVSCRWSHLGRVETDPGRLYMNQVPQGIDIAGTSARLQVYGLQAGLRYSF